jgi:hypothetical protein
MAVVAVRDEARQVNPLDLVEQIVAANDWPFDRRSDEEMAVEVPGRWCDYSLYFAWREDVGALHFTCAFDMRIPDAKRSNIHELLIHMNEKMWLGHFGLWVEEGVPMFRHAMLMRGLHEAGIEMLEDLVDVALAECERFYPAFQFVVWGGKGAAEALEAALIETVGEA